MEKTLAPGFRLLASSLPAPGQPVSRQLNRSPEPGANFHSAASQARYQFTVMSTGTSLNDSGCVDCGRGISSAQFETRQAG
jgi:hypothetical protein